MAMDLREVFEQSVQSLNRNRLRSGLTMLGIAWGLVTVVLLLSYGESLGGSVVRATSGIGSDVEMMWGGQTSMQAGGQRAGKKVKLEYADLDAIRHEVPLVRGVSAEIDDGMSFKYQSRIVNLQVKAVQMAYGHMRNLQIAEGRYFEPDDFTEHRQVCIFGPVAARKLFSGLPAVGQQIEVEGHTFEVIGVLQNKIQNSSNNGPDIENVFIPFELLRLLRNRRDPDSIVFEPLDPSLHDKAKLAVRAVLGARHDFSAQDEKAAPVWDTIEDQTQTRAFALGLEAILGIIGAMTLAVGGIGVMNIMLVSVTERTREIGIMKSLGARRRDIKRQFLLEAMALTFLAGAAGVVLSYVISWCVPAMPLFADPKNPLPNHEGDIVLHPSWQVMLISFAILAVVGITSGLLPALRAAGMDPVEALRHDK